MRSSILALLTMSDKVFSSFAASIIQIRHIVSDNAVGFKIFLGLKYIDF
jgi:hypothetical protein